MSSDLPPLPSIMRMHQAVTLDLICLGTVAQNLHCECFDAKYITLIYPQAVPKACAYITEWQRPEAVGQWCILKYDGDLNPGVITDISETHVKVYSMAKIGINRFFCPAQDDILWYLFDDSVSTNTPPKTVTSHGN